MRELLSRAIVSAAISDPKVIVLSGDHGYALFDAIRAQAPSQFVNVGVMEQAMIGIAAGLAKEGFRPIVYGLSAFVPIRVLEQIKLDVCYSKLPIIFLGDGAGLVYSTLGSSHQCGEDIACLRPLPYIQIYSPADKNELQQVFSEALISDVPSYIRIGKSDNPELLESKNLNGTSPYFTNRSKNRTKDRLFVAMGSMASIATKVAMHNDCDCISIPKIKPFPIEFLKMAIGYKEFVVIEEHSKFGGLRSSILDFLADNSSEFPKMVSYSLQEKFAETCGSYQHALSEHNLSEQCLLSSLT